MIDINTPEAILEETTSLLNFHSHRGDRVIYEVRDPDMPERTRDIAIDVPTWLDLGKPDQITLSIRPGDTLNEARARAYGPRTRVARGLTTLLMAMFGLILGVLVLGVAAAIGTGLLVLVQFMLGLLQGA